MPRMKHLSLALVISAAPAFVSTAVAQQPPAPVDFRPFTDGKHWIVKQPLTYIVGVSSDSVTVPRGFVTDFASIPAYLQSLIQPTGPNLLPAVVHDYLYWNQTCTREQADQIMLLAMIENDVPASQRNSIYRAVRLGGASAWNENAAARKRGDLRILPEDRIEIRARTLWPTYQRTLMDGGVVNPVDAPVSKGLCARGSMPINARSKRADLPLSLELDVRLRQQPALEEL
jgi:Protein of unknown function (DUF1353)